MAVVVDLRKEVQDPDGVEQTGEAVKSTAGQTAPMVDASKLAQELGVTIADALKPKEAPAQDDRPIHQQLGIKDSMAERMKEKLGGDEFDVLMGTMQGLAVTSQGNDVQIVDAIKQVSDDFAKQLKQQEDRLEKIRKAGTDTSQMWNMYGLDVFEKNKDDLKEFLDGQTEATNGVFGDAVDIFTKAQEDDNFDHLRKVKAGFEAFLDERYKDHDGVVGGAGVTGSRAELQEQQKSDAEYAKLEQELELAMSNRDNAKALQLQSQMKAML